MTSQLKLIFPPEPLPAIKGPGARKAEKLGHALVWAWSPNIPHWAEWDCTDCGMTAGDRVPPGTKPGEQWGCNAGVATRERCPGKQTEVAA